MIRSSAWSWPTKRVSQLAFNETPGHASCTARASPSTRMLKRNGESTLPWAIPESCQVSERSEPILTCENVPCTKYQRPHAPMDPHGEASTQEVSNASKMSTNATKMWVADRMCDTSIRAAPHRKPPWHWYNCGEMQGALLEWTICSNTLKQHDTKEMGR